MKVGIDGVLLGIWTDVKNASRILDIGTGTGLIALILAQRNKNSTIEAVDIEADAVSQAVENVKNSPWAERIKVQQVSLQEFAGRKNDRFDLIVSNPPYFVNSTKTPLQNRTTARHTDSLTHEELIENAIRLLAPNGRICIILPIIEGLQCVAFAKSKGLCCSNMVKVFPKPMVEAKRLLLEFTLQSLEQKETELIIESDIRHQYSTEFTTLAKDFYLKL